MKKTGQKLTTILLLTDFLVLNVSIFTSIWLKEGSWLLSVNTDVFFILYNSLFMLTILLYDKNVILKRQSFYHRTFFQIKSNVLLIFLVALTTLIFKLTDLSRLILFGTILIFLFGRIISYSFLFVLLSHFRSRGRSLKHLIVIGSNGISKQIRDYCTDHPYLGYVITAEIPVIVDSKSVIKNKKSIIADIVSAIESNPVDELIINLPLLEELLLKDVISLADRYGKRVRLIPDYYKIFKQNFRSGSFADIPVINIREIPLDNLIPAMVKRLYDIIFSIGVLVILSPIFLVVAILIKLTSKGPFLYNPERVGHQGKYFTMYKFRSMFINDNSDIGDNSTTISDPRITPLGQILRRTSLDELPQFLNVLMGDMSVVGPRPHRVWLDNKLSKEINNYSIRHYLRPGITGWAQVNGWRGPTSTEEEKQERTKHDIWYLENWSFLLDLKITLLTIFGKKVKIKAF
jgi:Undecaprenyl-phosphate glucose phosphotransferase